MQRVHAEDCWRIGLILLSSAMAICAAEAPASNETGTSADRGNEATRWEAMVPKYFENRPEFAFVEDDPALPRVLLIGDSISIGYTMPVRKRLLLVLPEGDKYEYLCARCGSSVGDKIDKSAAQQVYFIK